MGMSLAREIQLASMPSVFPAFPGRRELDIYAEVMAAEDVGGDFYDFCWTSENCLALLIADVSSKGIASAMFMMGARPLIRSLLQSGLSPAEALKRANDNLAEENEHGMFMTAWLGIVDFRSATLTCASAGHMPPLLLQGSDMGRPANCDRIKKLECRNGLALGAVQGAEYKEERFSLSEGDGLFLYTDGITNSEDSEGKHFGLERLLETLSENAEKSCREICASAVSEMKLFCGRKKSDDDIAILCFRFNSRMIPSAVEYNDVVEQAVEFSLKAHRDVKRKASGVPYILHPMEVAAISSRLTTEREVMAAALLHDTVEDAGITKEQIEKKFGGRVTELVMAETENKHREMPAAASWKMRKEESIRELRATGDIGVKVMWLSDKLSNLRSLYADWRKKGDGVWQAFNQKNPAEHAWLYMSIIECMDEFRETPEYKEYMAICREVFGSDWKL